MEIINIKIKEMFSGLKRDDYIYIGIVISFLITVIIIFFMTVNFFLKNINKIFYFEDTPDAQGLDIAQYTLVTKKLNITTSNNSAEANTSTITQTAPVITNTASLDKHAITIKILNGTTKKGLASTLAKSITDEGFTISKTGNEKIPYAITTLIIQENKSDYTQILLDALHKSYPQAIATTTSKTGDTDAVIIIGNN